MTDPPSMPYGGDARRPRSGPVSRLIGVGLLVVATFLITLGHSARMIAFRTLGHSESRRWSNALDYVRFGNATRRATGVAPSITLAIAATLTVFWTFLAIGGALAWLILNGFSPYLLPAAVILAVVLGVVVARANPAG